jgi:hypothetical protein
MSKLAWKPWHEVVQLRNELKTGELSLSIFAADLYDVVMGRARPIYPVFSPQDSIQVRVQRRGERLRARFG